ncbi:MAG: glycine cleavage system protein GcvH, partial [Deltaproteobacteria bacterium]|nr:glycine cleavage system protein GcvH [Deltaproteobacteria bacterium]
MRFPEDLRYHTGHGWARLEGEVATVGITDHAQKELGDVVFLELPKPGRKIRVGDVFGSIESSKSVSELVSPVSGEIVEVNAALEDSPELVNDDPYGEAWMIRVRLDPD